MEILKKKRAGFTLVELLVVIGIIAILASILVPATRNSFRKADQARAKTEIAAIMTAIRKYRDEYGRWPTRDTSGSDVTYNHKSSPKKQIEIMDILLAQDTANNPDNIYNRRKIIFIELSTDSMTGTDRDGDVYVVSDGYFLDPWGNPYVITLDLNNDNEITVSNLGSPTQDYVNGLPPGGGTFPGLTVGLLSYGYNPSETNAAIVSWTRE